MAGRYRGTGAIPPKKRDKRIAWRRLRMSEVVTPHAGGVASGASEPRSAVRLRWLVFGLCAATMFSEGYDAQFMGSVVPSIAAEWGVPAGALWWTLSAGLVG